MFTRLIIGVEVPCSRVGACVMPSEQSQALTLLQQDRL